MYDAYILTMLLILYLILYIISLIICIMWYARYVRLHGGYPQHHGLAVPRYPVRRPAVLPLLKSSFN